MIVLLQLYSFMELNGYLPQLNGSHFDTSQLLQVGSKYLQYLQNVTVFVFCLYWSSTRYHTIPTFNKPENNLMKTWWEKEEMLLTSISSFSHNVFYLSHKEFLFKFRLFCHLQMLLVLTSLKNLSSG